ncbi:cache domain-containing sensor histidine kinase [Paenibacillus thermotolerans]|uniref:cache domain-containing sensor histidine kinase n=1 Tax=Paenibacillus thermotolerans TaxID=3027807 RepID=UPI002367997C|nr:MULTISPECIES: sensor histidine kinase [unclassified Paenibacillus]
MIRKWRSFFHSITGQLFFLFFIGMIIPVAVGGYFSYRHSAAIIEDQVGKVATVTVTQVSDKVNLILKKLEDNSMFILGNPKIMDALEADSKEMTPFEYFTLNKEASQQLYSILNNSSEIMDIYIFDINRQNNIFSSTANMTGHWDEEWFHRIIKADGKPVWFGLTSKSFLKQADIGIPVFGLGRAVKNRDNGELLGVLFIEVRGTHLTQELQNVTFGDTGYTFVVDQSNNYIYHPDKTLYGSPSPFDLTANQYIRHYNGHELLIIPKRLMNEWYVMGLVPIEELHKDTKQIGRLTAVIMACSALYALVIGGVVTTKIARPLVHLNRLMRRGASGDLTVRSRFPGSNEIGQLGRSFDRMIEQIRLLIIQKETEEAEKKKAEIRALRYQINPHFLYNTLNTIRHLARFRRHDDVNRSITNLIPLLEASIERGGTFVSLGEEFDLLENYMVIQRYRYLDRPLSLAIDCPEELRAVVIPRMLLQPIVENAIFHGIAPKDGAGSITVTARKDGGDIHIQIADDGIGIEEERAARLIEQSRSQPRGMTKIGLFHVHQTLQLFYGASYGLTVASRYGEGTTVTLRLAANLPKEGEPHVV